jgi:hypothetical protein
MSLSNLDIAKLNFQQINSNDILKNIKETGLNSLQSLLVSKEQELQSKFLTALLKVMQDAGIDITTMPPTLPNFCPNKEILDKIIGIRNELVTGLNGISKTLDTVATVVTTANSIYDLVSKIPPTLKVIEDAIILGVSAIPTPPGVPGALISLAINIDNLRSSTVFDALGSPKLIKAKIKIETLTLTIDGFVATAKMILSLLDLLDKLINKCTKTNLVPVNNNLTQQVKKTETTSNQTSYQGFTIKIVDVPFNAKISKRKAVGYNAEGIPLIETPASFTTNSQVLIDELKLYIDNNNLKAY